MLVLVPAAASGANVRVCIGEMQSQGRVSAVLDGQTLVLEDGRVVRLAGIDIPPASAAESPDAGAIAYLRTVLAGRTLAIYAIATGLDRYGRVVAYVFVEGAGLEGPLQRAMVARGLARVAARVGEGACAAALLAQERRAREARLGLWPMRPTRREKPTSPLGCWRSAAVSP